MGRGKRKSKLNTGGRYNPSTNSWTATSTINAPSGRYLHTAVWTGSEMIVWGGWGVITLILISILAGNTIRSTNTWTATSTTNAPSGRHSHTAVWTGSEMIVWGGQGSFGLLIPVLDAIRAQTAWIATSITNTPPRRLGHRAVWTGTEMIVWGGHGDWLELDRWIQVADTNLPRIRGQPPTTRQLAAPITRRFGLAVK